MRVAAVLVVLGGALTKVAGGTGREATLRSAAPCDLLSVDCNTVSDKIPSVTPQLRVVSPAVTAALSPADRASFEHLLSHGLRQTAAVTWATREVAARLRRFLVFGGARAGMSEDMALSAAFADGTGNRGHSGYVGPYLPAVKAVIANGNIRETCAPPH